MRLKQIKLAGFKSFVDPTTVPFPGEMTAVLGPNGCGKSNIIDAVRWVLGESSAKNLRGDAMTDVIFNGSSARKPVSQASVELVFDNTSGRVGGEFARFNEIAVRRVVNRDAQSTYYLNGSKCRRRDITDLFLGTGLGPRSYAIIEQGMISRLIESKPQELRVFIEEAAGISRYKERRRETENRLKSTRENLERLEDVRQELGKQLDKLKRQAAAARRYKELKAQERSLKAELAALRWLAKHHELEHFDAQLSQRSVALEALNAELSEVASGRISLQTMLDQHRHEQEGIQHQLYEASNQITRLEQQIQNRRQRQRQIDDEQALLQQELIEVRAQGLSEQHQLQEVEQRIEQLALELETVEAAQYELQAQQELLIEQVEETRQRWQQLSDTVQQQQRQIELDSQRLQHQQSTQQREQQRYQALQQQLQADENSGDLDERIAQLHGQLDELNYALEQATLTVAAQQRQQQQAQIALEQRRAEREQAQLEQAGLSAQQQALATQLAQRHAQLSVAAGSADLGPKLAESIRVEPGFERVVEWLLADALPAQLVSALHQQPADQLCDAAVSLISNEADAQDSGAKLQTLGAKVQAPAAIVRYLNRFRVAESLHDALNQRAALAADEEWIVAEGIRVGRDWMLYPPASQTLDLLEQQHQLDTLNEALAAAEQSLARQHAMFANAQDELEAGRSQLERVERELQQQSLQQRDIQQQLQMLEQTRQHQQQQRARQQAQADELVELLAQLEADVAATEESLYQRETQLEHQQPLLEQSSIEKEQREQQLADLNARLLQTQQQQQQIQLLRTQLQGDIQSRTVSIDTALQTQQRIEQRLARLEQEAQQGELPDAEFSDALEQQLEIRVELEQQLIDKREQINQLEQQLKSGESAITQVERKRDELRAETEQLRVARESAHVKANSLLEQLEPLNVSLKQVLAEMPSHATESEWQTQLEKTSGNIQRLGAINLAAIEEYDSQSERKTYLDDQYQDLSAAIATLEEAIQKIDRETRQRFKTTYEQVNHDLQALFPKVFGGGSAYLELTESNLLDAGVTIMARPPGKKNSTIHLLSGGEKALTALSLVFAIFRLNPAPFCMLDEVDAPLDDANVGRFCNLVKEMSDTVQFIYITHNKVSMEMASHLTGVTMHEPGVSRMVAVDMEQAVALVEA